MSLSGKVCLVTGATRGIGKGIALQLGEAGATVYITGRTLKSSSGASGSLEETAKEIEARGGTCIPIPCDHSKDDQVENLFEKIKRDQDGQLDILVNNAYSGVNMIADAIGKSFYSQNPKTWDEINNVGLRNHYYCMVYASRMMAPRKQGMIVNISSIGGLRYLFNVPYGVGKCALDRLSADAAFELKRDKVTCVSLWPGSVKTENMVKLSEREIPKDAKIPGIEKIDQKLMRKVFFEEGESVEYSGKCVVHLACDPNKLKKTGKTLITGDVASEYGFTDIDGRSPNMRCVSTILKYAGWTKTAKLFPGFVKVPKSVMWMAGCRL